MKKIILSFLIFFAGYKAFSQRIYFIYLQTEQEQPFFVKMNSKVYSSEASGYLILSKLHDSTYNLNVGFPQNKWPEQKFLIKIDGKDHGYLVKNFGDKGWGLFDLQTLTVQMASIEAKSNESTTQSAVSPFTEILAKATGDSTLKQKVVIPKKEEKKTAATDQSTTTKNDTTVTELQVTKVMEPKAKDSEQVVNNKEPRTQQSAPYKKSTVTRKSESSTTTGLTVTYIDDYGIGKDTIKISIVEPAQTAKKNDQEKKKDVRFLDIIIDSTQVPVNNSVSKNQNEEANENKLLSADTATTQPILKNNCVAIADEKDFFELRKNMAASNGNDEMIDAAKKYFKTKCFSTAQIKNLSALFLDDSGKYKFFDAAYNYVSDAGNFKLLESELKDQYYIKRFKAML